MNDIIYILMWAGLFGYLGFATGAVIDMVTLWVNGRFETKRFIYTRTKKGDNA